jgi:hypothetical protein
MLTKILFTGLVIAIGIFVQRLRNRASAPAPVIRPAPPLVRAARPAPTWVRPAAYTFAIAIAASSAFWYYTTWRDDQRLVTIRVINTGSGDVAVYQAHKGDISGRRFLTTDGLEVRIADAERVEVSGSPQGL